jgi:hypothetical protein
MTWPIKITLHAVIEVVTHEQYVRGGLRTRADTGCRSRIDPSCRRVIPRR